MLQLSWVFWQMQQASYPECLPSGYFFETVPTRILGYSDQKTPYGSWRVVLLGIEFKFDYCCLSALSIVCFLNIFSYGLLLFPSVPGHFFKLKYSGFTMLC